MSDGSCVICGSATGTNKDGSHKKSCSKECLSKLKSQNASRVVARNRNHWRGFWMRRKSK